MHIYIYLYIYVCAAVIEPDTMIDTNESSHIHMHESCYGLATISRLLKIIGLFWRISSLLYGSFAKETYNFKEPTNWSHPIRICMSLHRSSYTCAWVMSCVNEAQICCAAAQQMSHVKRHRIGARINWLMWMSHVMYINTHESCHVYSYEWVMSWGTELVRRHTDWYEWVMSRIFIWMSHVMRHRSVARIHWLIRMSHVTCINMNESCRVYWYEWVMSWGAELLRGWTDWYEWVMSRISIWMCHVMYLDMNESCHEAQNCCTDKLINMNDLCRVYKYEWVMSCILIWISHVMYIDMNGSCHEARIVARIHWLIWMSHVTYIHMTESCHEAQNCCADELIDMNKSCHVYRYEWVMSRIFLWINETHHVWMSHVTYIDRNESFHV